MFAYLTIVLTDIQSWERLTEKAKPSARRGVFIEKAIDAG
jgi:hypothetical protein